MLYKVKDKLFLFILSKHTIVVPKETFAPYYILIGWANFINFFFYLSLVHFIHYIKYIHAFYTFVLFRYYNLT